MHKKPGLPRKVVATGQQLAIGQQLRRKGSRQREQTERDRKEEELGKCALLLGALKERWKRRGTSEILLLGRYSPHSLSQVYFQK